MLILRTWATDLTSPVLATERYLYEFCCHVMQNIWGVTGNRLQDDLHHFLNARIYPMASHSGCGIGSGSTAILTKIKQLLKINDNIYAHFAAFVANEWNTFTNKFPFLVCLLCVHLCSVKPYQTDQKINPNYQFDSDSEVAILSRV